MSNYLTNMKQKIIFFEDAIIKKKIDQIMVKDVLQPHWDTETRPRLLRQAAVGNLGQWAKA